MYGAAPVPGAAPGGGFYAGAQANSMTGEFFLSFILAFIVVLMLLWLYWRYSYECILYIDIVCINILTVISYYYIIY